MPDEEVEFTLSYYNTGSSWIDIEQLLDLFGLTRSALRDAVQVDAAIARVGERIPTYVTIRDVKKRWGHGQEDVFPVSQFEKLWGDMTRLPEVSIEDRKSTRLNFQSRTNLVCRLLLEKKKQKSTRLN